MTTREDILSPPSEAERPWRYDIQYGPEGEANYAWVYDGSGQMICTTRTHHAASIVEVMNRAAPTPPAAEAPGQEPVEAAGDVSPSYAIAKVIAKTVAASGVTSAMVTEAYRIAPWVGPDIIREMLKAALVSAPPTYADAEAKGFGKAFLDDLAKGFITLTSGDGDPYIKISYRNLKDAQRGYVLLIDAIRSLAPPAPKGET